MSSVKDFLIDFGAGSIGGVMVTFTGFPFEFRHKQHSENKNASEQHLNDQSNKANIQ